TPHRRHGGVRRPVGEDDTARLLLEQIPYVLIALLTETLDRLPRIDVLKSNLIDEKVVFPDDVEHDLTLTKPLVEQSLNNLRRVHVAVCDRVQNHIVLQSFCQIPRLQVDDDTRLWVVLSADGVAEETMKHRDVVKGRAPVRRERRLDEDLIVAVEERRVSRAHR